MRENDLFRALFDGALDAMILADDEGRLVEVNDAACRLLERTKPELLGVTAAQLMASGVDGEKTWRMFLERGQMRGQAPIRLKDGTTRILDFVARARILPGVHLSILRDQTQGQRDIERLRTNEYFLEQAQAVGKVGSWISAVSRAGDLTWSKEAFRIFGLPEGTPITVQTFFELVHPEDRAAVELASRRALEDDVPYEVEHRIVSAAGETRWVFQRARVERDASGAPLRMIGVVHDVTRRRREDAERNRLASIVESSEDAIFAVDREGVIISWNRGAARLFGYSADEVLGKPLSTLVPSDRAHELSLVLPRVVDGQGVEPFETRRIRKDGTLVDVLVTWSAIRDGNDRVVGVSAIVRDLTERRKAEAALRRTEDQLRQAQKMEAIGSLAGGVAHDFNNLLSIILSYTGLAIEGLGPSDPLRQDLDEVRRAGERAAELTRHLLAFSRRQILQPKVLDIGRLIGGMANMLRRMIGEDIELDIDVAPKVGGTLADPNQLEQVIMNLVANARDAMPRGGRIVIAVAEADLDVSGPFDASSLVPERYICISVADQGTGMTAATRARIFEPFYTTKEKGKGTGLGLSTVFGIVKQSGGHIHVESTLGRGSTFRVYLPRRTQTTDVVADEAAVAAPGGTETILLVEDEEPVRRIARTILQRHGYEVLEAQNAGEAFLICEQFGGRIDLMLTDVVMPRMSGRELAERLAPVRPDMHVLFMSGHTEDAVLRHGVSNASMAFLPKPFTPATLLGKVRDLLESGVRSERVAQLTL